MQPSPHLQSRELPPARRPIGADFPIRLRHRDRGEWWFMPAVMGPAQAAAFRRKMGDLAPGLLAKLSRLRIVDFRRGGGSWCSHVDDRSMWIHRPARAR